MSNNESEITKTIIDVLNTIKEKGSQYGDTSDKVEQMIKILYPNGIFHDDFDDLNIVHKLLEKISRATNNKISLESKIDAYKDIIGYSLLGLDQLIEKQKEETLPKEEAPVNAVIDKNKEQQIALLEDQVIGKFVNHPYFKTLLNMAKSSVIEMENNNNTNKNNE